MAWTTPGTATAGEVLTASFWNTNVRDNTDALYQSVRRLGYQQRTTTSTSTSTTFAGAADLFTTGITFTADGTSAYRIELFCSTYDLSAAARDIWIGLSIGGTETGRQQLFDVSSRTGGGLFTVRYVTPAAGSRTINFRHYHAGGATDLRAGDGTGTNLPPIWMAVFGPSII
jgi:hypothetical protein